MFNRERSQIDWLTAENQRLVEEARRESRVRCELAGAVRELSVELATSQAELRDLRRAFDTVWTNYLTDMANQA